MISAVLRLSAAMVGLGCVAAFAGPVHGTLYYTLFEGSPNVYKATYNYDGTSFTMGTPTAILSLPQGADGIIKAPNGDLLIGGQQENRVYQYNLASGTLVASPLTDSSDSEGSYHLSLSNDGTRVFTSDAYGGSTGALMEMAIDSSGLVTEGTRRAILFGTDRKVNNVLWVPPLPCPGAAVCIGTGMYYYINDDHDNGRGSFGSINIPNWSSLTTSTIFSGYDSVHSLAWDPFTNRITFFGKGNVGIWDPIGAPAAPTQKILAADFDQGVLDGQGHALIAGAGAITFVDYSATGDITSPLNPLFAINGLGNIDDVLADFQQGAETPEPGTLLLTGGAVLLGLGKLRRAGKFQA